MKKSIIVIFYMLLTISLIFSFGCENDFLETDELAPSEEMNAAHRLIEEKFKTSPDNFAIMSYEINSAEEFRFIEMKDDMYVIRGGFQCSYGWSKEKSVLEMEVEADYTLKRSVEGNWSIEGITPVRIESDAEKKGKGWITSVDESSLVPFISTKEVEEGKMQIPSIAQNLLGKLMVEFSNYEREKATFLLAVASSSALNLEQIKVPEGWNDVKACWKIEEGINGSYLGYIEGLGYMSPMLQTDFESQNMTLNQKPLYLVKKQDGYYLETFAVFEGGIKGEIF
ncbi:hypothetical protein [Emergencia sp. 1XD21-10]|uniref:hypothetical protein n=1 Tax=Emergencia sp. 1XD21-10 TaxID=2304569 RepID=UPI00137A38A6|nr:hypothetical protein [Emergencia sp. 1XD21-10]NCE99415.1 hypothetical protein [Emergencia sp. 1XD21-10]